jgi:hypothetical protein
MLSKLATRQHFLFVILFLLFTLEIVRRTAFPGSFDELQHISYAAFLQETGDLLPHFEQQKTLSSADLRHWTQEPNYVGHPSPFYLFEQLFLDRALAPASAILAPRLASLSLLLIGVILTLCAGWPHFRNDPYAGFLFCAVIVLCPKLLVISSQVTNDSLAFLGGALVYGAVNTSYQQRLWSHCLTVLGLAFGFWAKLNAGLLISCWLGFYLLVSRPHRLDILIYGCIGGLVGLIPYGIMVAQYGHFVPIALETMMPGEPSHGPFPDFWVSFLFSLGATWGFDQRQTYVVPALFWLMMASTGWVSYRAWRRRDQLPAAIAVTAPMAFAAVLPVHLWFASTALNHSIFAASFRYYLPVWPMMAHNLAYGVINPHRPWQRNILFLLVLSALAAGLLNGAVGRLP